MLGVRIAFFSNDGRELRVGNSRPRCSYCRLIRKQPAVEALCLTLDNKEREQAGKTGALTTYTCHGGMVEAVMPVVVAHRQIGFMMIGQFRRRDFPSPDFLRTTPPARHKMIKQAYKRTPKLRRDQLVHTLGMFELLVNHMAGNHLVDVKDTISPVLASLRESPGARLSLAEAAALAGCSPAVLSRTFRRTLGQGYRDTRIALILDQADALFRSCSGIRVQEVAARLGFDDPLYFSRLYKKHRGKCPRDALRFPPA